MTKVAIAFSSKDRAELTEKTIVPLLQPDKFDLIWVDGSQTDEGKALLAKYDGRYCVAHHGVTGGSCRAIVYSLTQMLRDTPYDFVGLVENDVLLHDGWFDSIMTLFEKGEEEGLKVGAVSARNYVDRVLIQRDGYSINHNLGAGMQIFTREAAELILRTYRTGMSSENRKIFSILSGIDIGGFWAFRGSDHMLVADWTWDHILAAHGYCSLALTPAKATQLEDIAAMGLQTVDAEIEERRNGQAFAEFVNCSAAIRSGEMKMPIQPGNRLYHDQYHTIFPHQIGQLGGSYEGDWRFKWSMSYGCFAWKAGTLLNHPMTPVVTVPVFGPCELLISGGERGGKVKVEDAAGFRCEPELQPEGSEGAVLRLAVPAAVTYREIKLTALTPGIVFYGVRSREAQPFYPEVKFDFRSLPPL